jgi:hypothetical protein
MLRAAAAFPVRNAYKAVTNRIQTEKSTTWRLRRLGRRWFSGRKSCHGLAVRKAPPTVRAARRARRRLGSVSSLHSDDFLLGNSMNTTELMHATELQSKLAAALAAAVVVLVTLLL